MATPIRYKEGKTAGWRVNFRHKGKTLQRRFQDKQFGGRWEAHRQALAYIEAIKSGLPVMKSGEQINQSITDFLNWRKKVKNLSDTTMRSDKQRLSIYQRFMNDNNFLTTETISIDTARLFMKYYFDNAPFTKNLNNKRHNPNTAATWEKYRQVLSVFFNWCVNEKILTINPISNNKDFLVPFQKKQRIIYDEPDLILKYFKENHNQMTVAFFSFLAYTGCRLSEATGLKWSEVNFTRSEITFIDTKNNEVRIIPISNKLQTILKQLNKSDGFVFGKGDEKYRSDSWYLKRLYDAKEYLGIKKGDLHSFRHTFITNLIEAGVDLATVKELAGHKRIETTMKYCHITGKSKRKSIELLPY